MKRLLRQEPCVPGRWAAGTPRQNFFLYQANDDAGDIVFTMDHICDICLQHTSTTRSPASMRKKKEPAELCGKVTTSWRIADASFCAKILTG